MRFVVLIAGIATTSAAAAPATPVERANAVAAAFSSWCVHAAPDSVALGQRASRASLEVIVDRTIPMPDGVPLKQKNWLIPDATGALMLTSEDLTHNSVHVTGCGVVAVDADGAQLERALSGTSQLGAPSKRVDPTQGGSVAVWWNVQESEASAGDQVMLAYRVPGQPGVIVNLIDRKPVGN